MVNFHCYLKCLSRKDCFELHIYDITRLILTQFAVKVVAKVSAQSSRVALFACVKRHKYIPPAAVGQISSPQCVSDWGDSHTHQTWACASCSRHTNIKLIHHRKGGVSLLFSEQPGYEISLRAQPALTATLIHSSSSTSHSRPQNATSAFGCIVNKHARTLTALFNSTRFFTAPESANKWLDQPSVQVSI